MLNLRIPFVFASSLRLTQIGVRYKSAASVASPTSNTPSRNVFELGAQLERQSEIIAGIKQVKQEIVTKQNVGRNLALKVSDQDADLASHLEASGHTSAAAATSQNERFERQQRFQMFTEKMMQLYKSEKRLAQRQSQAFARMEMAPVQSMAPVKTCLAEYAKLSTSGFNCGVLAESLRLLNQTIAASGNNPVSINDLNLGEMDQSWRLDKVTQDLHYGLDPSPNVFFSPYNMAKVSRELGTMGYKNTEIVPRFFDKLDSMLERPSTDDYIEGAKVGFDQAQFGGQKGMGMRHYIYQGFSGSDEFTEHVQTLLEYQQYKRQQLGAGSGTDPSRRSATSAELAEVEQAAQTLIEASKDVKNMQKEMEAAVRNVRLQYQRLKEAHDKHTFLSEHKYIQLDLLELQELLIKAGYLHPEEQPLQNAEHIGHVGTLGMDAAVEVFYDMVLNSYPDALSPQYDLFYEASLKSSPKSVEKKDLHTDLNMQTLSSTLVGLEQQALSYRRDVVDKDYPTEFYESLVLPEEKWYERSEHMLSQEQKRQAAGMLSTHVKMERTYLNAWKTFMERTENIPSVISKMLSTGPVTLEDLYSALRALNVTRFQATEIRDEIGRQFLITKGQAKNSQVDQQALVDGAVGLAGCTYKFNGSDQMTEVLLQKLQKKKRNGTKVINQLTFGQAIELLKALSTPGMNNNSKQMYASVKDILVRLNSMNFDVISNELTFREFDQLYDAYVNLKHSEVKSMRDLWLTSFSDESLRRAFDLREMAQLNYAENESANYDPIKPRVLGAFTESLARANLQDLHIMQTGQAEGLQKDMFPYAPDLLMSHGGQKVGLFVLNTDAAMRDTHEPEGFMAAKMRLISQAHALAGKTGNSVMKGVPLAVDAVVDANLREYRLSLRKDFDIGEYLEQQGLGDNKSSTQVTTKPLTEFSANLSAEAVRQADTTSIEFEEFLTQLLAVLKKCDKLKSVFENEQVLIAIDEIKLQLLKLLTLHGSSLTVLDKQLIQKSLPNGYSSLDELVKKGLVEPMISAQNAIDREMEQSAQAPATFWQGIRQEVEIPPHQGQKDLQPKSILPELLNQDFLWYERYHQYSDWEQEMRGAYDQFNLMELPANTADSPSFYFNAHDFNRRVPKGIFPDARRPRTVLRQPGSTLQVNAAELESSLDAMTRFERSPMQAMVKGELVRNVDFASRDVPSNIRAMTNLQNIKHSLKSDLADQQVCDFLFVNLSFTDKLIEEHLSKTNKNTAKTKFLARDAENYRQFINEMGRKSRFVSPYDHFYMREAQRKGRPEDIHQQLHELDQEHLVRPVEETAAIREKLHKELEKILLNYERANEDSFNLSKALESKVEVTIDVEALTPVQSRNATGLRPSQLEMAPESYLKQQRCRAEANLIKARLAYKVHSEIDLTENEAQYLDAWMAAAQSTQTLLPEADVLVPSEPSALTLAQALSPEDFYALNSLSRVSIGSDERNVIALNDLVLELSLFVDTDTVNQVELGLLEDNLKKEWRLGNDFTLSSRRNKEIDLVMREMEEITWRAANQFNDQERETLETLVFFDRGSDAFDNAFLGMDKASFASFFNEANCYDDRITLLENWMCRKDEEVRQRVSLPPPQLVNSDAVLFDKLDAPLKQAREKIVGQMLTTDEFGESRMSNKAYSELTTRELHLLAEGLSVRLNLFQQKYPAFLPQVIRAVIEHENLAGSDRSMLSTYCKMFELDWRGDHAIENREQFMLTNPVYMNEYDRSSLATYGEVNNARVSRQIRQACQPFMPHLLTQMKNMVADSATKKTE